MDSDTTLQISRARAAGDTDRATELEQKYEHDLARSGDEDRMAAEGYDPAALRKEHGSKKSSAAVSKKPAKKAAAKKGN